MPIIVSLFNNKGGVGKTTFLFHVAHQLADIGKTVLMVDCDSQCNLTAYSLAEAAIDQAWQPGGNSIYRQIEPVHRTIGDIRNRAPSPVSIRLHLVPGDLSLSEFEDRLGDSWSSARGGNEAALRAQSAIYRVILQSIQKSSAQIVLLDLGPNLGAINRAVLAGSDYIITPVSPDLFSIRGTENLGNKLVTWRSEWDQCNAAWAGNGIEIPSGHPKFLGYITQQHNIVTKLTPLGQVAPPTAGSYDLGMIPNLHSLIPYSLAARKPVFHCTSADGLRGAHTTSAQSSRALFETVANVLAAMA